MVYNLFELNKCNIRHPHHLKKWLYCPQNLIRVRSNLVKIFLTDAKFALFANGAAVGGLIQFLHTFLIIIVRIIIMYQILQLLFILCKFFFNFVKKGNFTLRVVNLQLIGLFFVDDNIVFIILHFF